VTGGHGEWRVLKRERRWTSAALSLARSRSRLQSLLYSLLISPTFSRCVRPPPGSTPQLALGGPQQALCRRRRRHLRRCVLLRGCDTRSRARLHARRSVGQPPSLAESAGRHGPGVAWKGHLSLHFIPGLGGGVGASTWRAGTGVLQSPLPADAPRNRNARAFSASSFFCAAGNNDSSPPASPSARLAPPTHVAGPPTRGCCRPVNAQSKGWWSRSVGAGRVCGRGEAGATRHALARPCARPLVFFPLVSLTSPCPPGLPPRTLSYSPPPHSSCSSSPSPPWPWSRPRPPPSRR